MRAIVPFGLIGKFALTSTYRSTMNLSDCRGSRNAAFHGAEHRVSIRARHSRRRAWRNRQKLSLLVKRACLAVRQCSPVAVRSYDGPGQFPMCPWQRKFVTGAALSSRYWQSRRTASPPDIRMARAIRWAVVARGARPCYGCRGRCPRGQDRESPMPRTSTGPSLPRSGRNPVRSMGCRCSGRA